MTNGKQKQILRFQSASDINDWTQVAHPIKGKELAERRKVLIAYDSSSSGDYALQWTFDGLIQDGNDHVILVTAVEQSQPLMRFNFNKGEDEIRTEIQKRYEAVQAVHETLASLFRKRDISCQSFILEGDARDVILEVADKTRADCIVMGARGLNAVHRAVLGSASLFITQQAQVPVVVVKRPKGAKGAEVLPLERTESFGSILDWLSLKDKSIEKKFRDNHGRRPSVAPVEQ